MFTREQFDTAVKDAGGLTVVAFKVGDSPQAVLNWRSRRVPANKCKAFSAVTGLRLQDLRDDWADYWPELAESHDGETA